MGVKRHVEITVGRKRREGGGWRTEKWVRVMRKSRAQAG